MSWLDILLGAVMVLHIVNGYGSGMVKVLFDVASFLVVFVLSLVLSRILGDLILKYVDLSYITMQQEVIQKIGIEVAPENIPKLIVSLLIFVVLFIMISLAFRIFPRGFHWTKRIPFVGLFNRLGGSVMGAAIGAAFVYIIIVVMSLIPVQFFISALGKSVIVFYSEQYISAYALELKEFLINYYKIS